MRRYLTWLAVTVAIATGIGFFVEMIMQDGRSASLQVASETGFCTGDPCTSNEEDAFYAMALESFGYSPMRINWCLGIDELATRRVYRGGWVKSLFVKVGRMPCGKLLSDDTST